MIKVTLTEEENQLKDSGGIQRQLRAENDGRKDRHGFDGDPLETHQFGIGCEIAVYKALGLEWKDTPYEKGERDLPNGFEIRGRRKHWYDLLVWTSDDPNRAYILVTKENKDPDYRVIGLMLGEDAKQVQYKRQVTGRKASYFVPHSDLIPIEQLLDVIPRTCES